MSLFGGSGDLILPAACTGPAVIRLPSADCHYSDWEPLPCTRPNLALNPVHPPLFWGASKSRNILFGGFFVGIKPAYCGSGSGVPQGSVPGFLPRSAVTLTLASRMHLRGSHGVNSLDVCLNVLHAALAGQHRA